MSDHTIRTYQLVSGANARVTAVCASDPTPDGWPDGSHVGIEFWQGVTASYMVAGITPDEARLIGKGLIDMANVAEGDW